MAEIHNGGINAKFSWKNRIFFNLEAPSFLNFDFQLKVWLRKLFSWAFLKICKKFHDDSYFRTEDIEKKLSALLVLIWRLHFQTQENKWIYCCNSVKYYSCFIELCHISKQLFSSLTCKWTLHCGAVHLVRTLYSTCKHLKHTTKFCLVLTWLAMYTVSNGPSGKV